MPNIPGPGLNPAQQQIAQRLERFRRYVFDATDLRLAIERFRVRLVTDGLSPEEEANETLRSTLEWVVERGPVTVRQHAVVDYWAALEVFVEDVFADVCAAIDLSDNERLAKVRVSLAEFSKMSDEQRFRELWARMDSPARSAVKRWDDLLGTIGIDVDVEAVEPHADWPDRDNASVRVVLRELQQVRNVIVHRGGIVDTKLVAAGTEGRFVEGTELAVSDESVDEYGQAAVDYAGGTAVAAVAVVA